MEIMLIDIRDKVIESRPWTDCVWLINGYLQCTGNYETRYLL